MGTNMISETALYLTFRIETEYFAIDVSQVREVLDLDNITRIPNTLEFMRGVINVRGSVVPVMDLRMKFGESQTDTTLDTRIIVMELLVDGEPTVLGAIADSVHEVLELEPDQIEPPPAIGKRWLTDNIKGVGKRNDEFIMILDINKVFSVDELIEVKAAGTSADTLPEEATVDQVAA